jgi:nucleoside-diphosphate-sugar epimerase
MLSGLWEANLMKTVLVTGAGGFVGRQSLIFLREIGFEVHAVDYREPMASMDSNSHWHCVDLFQPREVEDLFLTLRPTHLLHFAWEATPGRYWNSLDNFKWVQTTFSLLETFREQGGQRAVLAGSCAETFSDETPYAVCKRALRDMAHVWARQAGVSLGWGRIFFLYGPHEAATRFVPSVILSMLKGEEARCSHGKQIRDFLHVRDVASAFARLLDSDVEGIVDIASGVPVTLKDVVCNIADKLDASELIRLGALPSSPDEPARLVADVARLSKEVAWSPQYNLDQGLNETIAWWKDNLKAARS